MSYVVIVAGTHRGGIYCSVVEAHADGQPEC